MKTKIKSILYIIISLIVVGFFTTAVMGLSDLANLKGTGNSQIGKRFLLGYSSIKGNTGAYCIQHGKELKSDAKQFVLTNYVEINGKEAKIYGSSDTTTPSIINNDLNAQIAYILNKNEGYGTAQTPTKSQQALWHINNEWVKSIFGEGNKYIYVGNDFDPNEINQEAENYSNTVGDKMVVSDPSQIKKLSVTDKTNKDDLTIVDVGEYYRIGPFKWEFEGTLQNITAVGDNGDISGSDVKFVKYEGNTPNFVEASQIATGESFYVDVKQSANVKQFKGLKLQTASSTESTKVYTANIWFLESSTYQNLIYTEIGEADVEPLKGEGSGEYEVPFEIEIGLLKVDDRDTTIPLENVGFKFKAKVYRNSEWVIRYLGKDLKWSEEKIEDAKIFYTDKEGKITETISGETTVKNSMKAIEVTNDNYGYLDNVGKEYTMGKITETKFANHQYKVKLSGYVWIDTHDGKTTVRNDEYDQNTDNNGNGFDGITVYLKDKNGNVVNKTTTSELGLYSEIKGGEYQFVDVDLDKVQKGEYYIEFEYCGITYQSVNPKLNQSNGSKAIDTNTRNILDSKFTSVDGTGTQNLNINGVTVNYNSTSDHKSTINSHDGCNVYARTNEAGYDLYSGFKPASEEIRNINLGLYEKAQTDYALSQDLYNVRVSVNGFSHIYRYASVRYNNNGNTVNEESSWNVGVKFQNNRGTYSRAIYTSDKDYTAPNHKDNELKVYVTYKIALRNESSYLGRINSIIDYCDNKYEMIAAGTSIDDNDNISGNLKFGTKTAYDSKYSKYTIDVNSTIKSGETNYLYVQFQMNREAVLQIVNGGELLNNLAEINSYTTFKNNNENTPVAVIDQDSVPGNVKPGQIDTYEDDTDAARSLQLEFKNARSLTGTVFVDSTGKDSNTVYANEERKGNGIFDNGETTLAGIKVKLYEVGKDDRSYDGERVEMETTTDESGNFTFTGYIPGKYNITYTWGDKTYKVQYYKGTVYDETRDQNNQYWYKDNVDIRKTDALDDANTRKTIDEEMRKITKNTIDSEINKAYEEGSEIIKTTTMNSTTPTMAFSVEYDTTITDGNADKVEFIIKNIDFGIVERPKQQIELSKRVSGFKITLANGQILIDAEVTEDGKLKGTHDHVTYMGPTSLNEIDVNGILRAEMDTELIEGATLETTYTIKATNASELDYTSDRYYYYGNKDGSEAVKASVTGVVDYVDGRLSVIDDKWEEKDQAFLNDFNASQKDNSEYLNSTRTYFTTQLSKALAPGESNAVDIKTSKLLTSTDDNTFDNQSEIVDVTKSDGFNTGVPVKLNWSEDKFYFDVADAEKVIIIPSTGEDKNYVLPVVIGMSALLLLGVGAFGIKKFIIDNK